MPRSVLALSMTSSASWSSSAGGSDAEGDFVQQRPGPELRCVQEVSWNRIPACAEHGFTLPRLLECVEFHQCGFGLHYSSKLCEAAEGHF